MANPVSEEAKKAQGAKAQGIEEQGNNTPVQEHVRPTLEGLQKMRVGVKKEMQ